MMFLPRILSPGLIRVHVAASEKEALLKELSDLLALASPMANGEPLDAETIYRVVLARENERTSALGEGCALPHARIEGLAAPAACLAVLSKGLDMGAPDGEPVRIVCLLLAPLEDPSVTLKVMAEVALIMSDPGLQAKVESAPDAIAIHDLLRDLDTGEESALRARNIMRKPYYTIHPETPLTELTRLLAVHGQDATSVTDGEGRVVGMVTCDLLFRFGLPEFFGQLKSVAFVKNFDPFENYFKGLKTAVAADVMTQEFTALPEDATLLEVVFELSVRGRNKVFVVRDGILVGIIDRIAVLNRVLNF
jgi:PTS system nitrogen regulatory IIA component